MLLSTIASLLALTASTLAAPLAEPKAPTFTYLYTANLTLSKPIDMGTGPMGGRRMIPFTGGTFSGPKLNGAFSHHATYGTARTWP
jgi:hypothetical protein